MIKYSVLCLIYRYIKEVSSNNWKMNFWILKLNKKLKKESKMDILNILKKIFLEKMG